MTTYGQFAIRTVRRAGERLLKHFRRIDGPIIYRKSKHELVTRSDYESNHIILSAIRKAFPDHGIVSEESKAEDRATEFQWIIDPLDGTSNFIIKDPLFCVSLALAYRGSLIMSAIWAPAIKELYFTEQGHGAFLNNRKIHVSRARQLSTTMVLLARSHDQASRHAVVAMTHRLTDKAENTKMLGSTSLNLAFTAAGRVGACLIAPPKVLLWDASPGVLLVREAGGKVIDFHGQAWQPDGYGLIAGNQTLCRQILRITRSSK